MAKDRQTGGGGESMISIVAQGTRIVGECELEGSIRIEGRLEGSVRAGKAVVVGKDGVVEGDIFTQDAVIAGSVRGLLIAESRLELQASCRIDGDVRARRMQLEEGAVLNGTVQMGEVKAAGAPGAGADGGMNAAGAKGLARRADEPAAGAGEAGPEDDASREPDEKAEAAQ